MMKQFSLLIMSSFLLLGCSQSFESVSLEKTWVYIELEVSTTDDSSSYYYYGQIYQRILDKLAHNDDFNSIFIVTKVRYIDDNDEIVEYADEIDTGTLFFRTEDIVKIEVLREDPLSSNHLGDNSVTDSSNAN